MEMMALAATVGMQSYKKRSRIANNLKSILKQSYEKLPTVTARPNDTEIKFSDMISVATSIKNNHHIINNELVRMHTAYKNTRGKVRSIHPSLVWHDTKKKKKKKKEKEMMSTFIRKAVLSALPGITTQRSTTTFDPNTKTIYGKIRIGITNNTYDRLENDEDNTPQAYKKSWILNTACSRNYADDNMIVRDKKDIEPGTGINVGCANTSVMQQTG